MAYMSTIQALEEMKDAHITLGLAANDVDIVAMYIDLAELMSHQLISYCKALAKRWRSRQLAIVYYRAES